MLSICCLSLSSPASQSSFYPVKVLFFLKKSYFMTTSFPIVHIGIINGFIKLYFLPVFDRVSVLTCMMYNREALSRFVLLYYLLVN